MDKGISREELEYDIRTIEEQIIELINAETPNMAELNRLHDLLDEKENALEELTIDMAQNSGVDFKTAHKNEKLKEDECLKDITNQSEKTKEEQDELASKQNEEVNRVSNNESNFDTRSFSNGIGLKLTLLDWQIKTGIEIIPDEYIKQKHNKFIDEEEFKEILTNENVPKIIQEPGKAEMYLKTEGDWESVRTSLDALRNAVESGNFPRDVYDESYILLQYDKDKVFDEDKNSESDGYGKIDQEDIFGTRGADELREEVDDEKELQYEASKQGESGNLWDKIKAGLKSGIKAHLVKEALEMAKDSIEMLENINSQVGMAALAIDIVGHDAKIGKKAFEKVMHEVNKDANNSNLIIEESQLPGGDDEELLPGQNRKNY